MHSPTFHLQGLSYGRTELLVADMRLLEPDPTAGREFPDVAFALPDVDLDMRKVDISTLLSRNQALSAISELPFFF